MATSAFETDGAGGQDGAELFMELFRHYPLAKVGDYYACGKWRLEQLEVDMVLIVAHRREAGAPDPPTLDELELPELPSAKAKLGPMPPSAPPRGGKGQLGGKGPLGPRPSSTTPPARPARHVSAGLQTPWARIRRPIGAAAAPTLRSRSFNHSSSTAAVTWRSQAFAVKKSFLKAPGKLGGARRCAGGSAPAAVVKKFPNGGSLATERPPFEDSAARLASRYAPEVASKTAVAPSQRPSAARKPPMPSGRFLVATASRPLGGKGIGGASAPSSKVATAPGGPRMAKGSRPPEASKLATASDGRLVATAGRSGVNDVAGQQQPGDLIRKLLRKR